MAAESTPIPIRRVKKIPRLKNTYEDKYTLEDLLAGFIASIIEKLTDIEKYSLQSRVLYRHNVITSDLPAIYAMASVFAYPSVFEGFGIPILEALCTATPVIASTGTCFEEVGGASTLYVDPNNPQQWAQAINTVLTDNALREKMKADGLTFADKFSDATIADNIMAVYNKLK